MFKQIFCSIVNGIRSYFALISVLFFVLIISSVLLMNYETGQQNAMASFKTTNTRTTIKNITKATVTDSDKTSKMLGVDAYIIQSTVDKKTTNIICYGDPTVINDTSVTVYRNAREKSGNVYGNQAIVNKGYEQTKHNVNLVRPYRIISQLLFLVSLVLVNVGMWLNRKPKTNRNKKNN